MLEGVSEGIPKANGIDGSTAVSGERSENKSNSN
jgi:hypothetical protein